MSREDKLRFSTVERLCGGDADAMTEELEPLWLIALLLRVLEAFGCYISLHSARSACRLTVLGRTAVTSGARGRVRVRSEMEAFVDLFRVPGRPLGNPPLVIFNLGRGGVPRGRPVAGQLRGTLLRAELTHLTLCVSVWVRGDYTFFAFPFSNSPAGTSG